MCELNKLKHAYLLGTYGKGTLTLDPAELILRKEHGPQGFPSTAAPWLTEHGPAQGQEGKIAPSASGAEDGHLERAALGN